MQQQTRRRLTVPSVKCGQRANKAPRRYKRLCGVVFDRIHARQPIVRAADSARYARNLPLNPGDRTPRRCLRKLAATGVFYDLIRRRLGFDVGVCLYSQCGHQSSPSYRYRPLSTESLPVVTSPHLLGLSIGAAAVTPFPCRSFHSEISPIAHLLIDRK